MLLAQLLFLVVTIIFVVNGNVMLKRPEMDNGSELSCPEGHEAFHTGTEVRCCLACPKGQGMISYCTSENNTVCDTCTHGIDFSKYVSAEKRCEPCTLCHDLPPNAIPWRSCNITHDTVCGCTSKQEYFNSETNTCQSCSYCAAGNFAKSVCGFFHDTVCGRGCGEGWFSRFPTFKNRRCQQCRPSCNANLNEVEVLACSLVSNRVCCPANNLSCAARMYEEELMKRTNSLWTIDDIIAIDDKIPDEENFYSNLIPNGNYTRYSNPPQTLSSNDLIPLYCVLMSMVVLSLIAYVVYKYHRQRLCHSCCYKGANQRSSNAKFNPLLCNNTTTAKGAQELKHVSDGSSYGKTKLKLESCGKPVTMYPASAYTPVLYDNNGNYTSMTSAAANSNSATDKFLTTSSLCPYVINENLKQNIYRGSPLINKDNYLHNISRKHLKEIATLLNSSDKSSDLITTVKSVPQDSDSTAHTGWTNLAVLFGYNNESINKFKLQSHASKSHKTSAYLFLKHLAHRGYIKPSTSNGHDSLSSSASSSTEEQQNGTQIEKNHTDNLSPVTIANLSDALCQLGRADVDECLLRFSECQQVGDNCKVPGKDDDNLIHVQMGVF